MFSVGLRPLVRYWRAGKQPADMVPVEVPFRELHAHVRDVQASLAAACGSQARGDWPMVRMHLILLDHAAEAICQQSNRELAYRHGLCDDEDGAW